jgi:hypothetical protein
VRPIDQPDQRYQLGRRRVVPDVSVPAAQALDIAYAKALRDALRAAGDASGVHELAVRAEAEAALAERVPTRVS